MGNRAVIQFGDEPVGVYLHWNGGPESVRAFLDVCRDGGVRDHESDPHYCLSRVVQVIANFFGGTASIGIGLVETLDTENSDNGTYQVGPGWSLSQRTRRGGNVFTRLNDAELREDDHYKGVYKAAREATRF